MRKNKRKSSWEWYAVKLLYESTISGEPDEDKKDKNFSNEFKLYMVSIPITADLAFSGHITEALAYESKYTLTPAFYDLTLRTKTARDDESEAMLDIIFNNKNYDLGTFNTSFLVHDIFPKSVSTSGGNMVSLIESRKGAINAAIEKFNGSY